MPLPSKAASLPNRGLHRKLVTAGMAPAEGQSADAMTIRMIVSDLDGTLLLPDKSTSARTRRAIAAAQDAGILVVAATGRSVIDMPKVLPAQLRDLAVCSNGAVVYNAADDTVLAERPIAAEVCAALIESLLDLAPDTRFATLTRSGYDLLPGPGYLGLMEPGNHGRNPEDLDEVPMSGLSAQPAVKIIARHGELPLETLFELCEQVARVGVLPTTSSMQFIEISAAGVSKASTLELLAAEHGFTADEVLAFGDSANDREMLGWAGHGVALANGTAPALATADEIAPANTDDGVAVVIERLLACGGRF